MGRPGETNAWPEGPGSVGCVHVTVMGSGVPSACEIGAEPGTTGRTLVRVVAADFMTKPTFGKSFIERRNLILGESLN